MKKVISMGIIGVVISVMLLASPLLASASYSKIYGNANEDDVLDMRDVTYIKLVIFGKKPATTLADANNDGKISMLDIGQTKLIILDKEKQLTFVDQADRTVTVPRPIERVVSLSRTGTRLMFELGAVNRLVGIDSYIANPKYADKFVFVRACPKIKELPSIGSPSNPNMEVIVSLKPDLIIGDNADGANTLQENIGIPVVCVWAQPHRDFGLDAYEFLGTITGTEERAEEFVSYAKGKMEEITEVTSKIPDSEKPRVYVSSVCMCTEITRCEVKYEIVELAGGINVASSEIPTCSWPAVDISKEQLLMWNPDFILIHSGSQEHPYTIDDVLNDPDLQSISAIQNKNVYYTKSYYIAWNTVTGLSELFYMAKLFHPDKFEDLNVEKEGNEILKMADGVDGLYTEMAELCDLHRWD
jgi:iron complex transport system substrate-binding protein